MWDLETGKRTLELKEHKNEVMTLSIHPKDSNLFLSSGVDAQVKLWDIRSPKSVQTAQPHTLDVNCVTFFPNGDAFATASDDKTVKLYDLRAAAEVLVYKMNSVNVPITSVSFSKSGKYLFAGQDDGTVNVYDTLRGDGLYKLDAHSLRVSCAFIAPDGMSLCTSSWDNELKIWA